MNYLLFIFKILQIVLGWTESPWMRGIKSDIFNIVNYAQINPKQRFWVVEEFQDLQVYYDKYVCRWHTVTMSERNNSMSILRGLLNDFNAEESTCSSWNSWDAFLQNWKDRKEFKPLLKGELKRLQK